MKKSSCEYDYKIGKYNTLSKAKLACSSEKKCSAIQDKHCDDKGPFEMCSRAKTGMRSSSCVYKKRENLGRLWYYNPNLMVYCYTNHDTKLKLLNSYTNYNYLSFSIRIRFYSL